MANSSSSSPEAPPRRPEYVGFWKRLLAVVIDTLILTVIAVPLLLAIYGRDYFQIAQERGGLAGFWDFMIQIVLPTVATILFWRYRGASPGKMAISAKIVDAATGQPASTAKLVGRFFAYTLSLLPLGAGFLWIALDARKQGFHDKLAGTVVVYEDD